MYNIFIDDKLRPSDIYYKKSNPKYKEEFIVVKSIESFKEIVEKEWLVNKSYPGFISFDYLLSDIEMQISSTMMIHYNEDAYIPTGVDCTEWYLDFCKKNKIPLPEYIIHDENVTGRRLINKLFKNFVPEQEESVSDNNVKTSENEIIVPSNDFEINIDTNTSFGETSKNVSKSKKNDILSDSLIEFMKDKGITRIEINDFLLSKISNYLTLEQKMNIIGNLLWKLSNKKIIVNTGTIRKPLWKLN